MRDRINTNGFPYPHADQWGASPISKYNVLTHHKLEYDYFGLYNIEYFNCELYLFFTINCLLIYGIYLTTIRIHNKPIILQLGWLLIFSLIFCLKLLYNYSFPYDFSILNLDDQIYALKEKLPKNNYASDVISLNNLFIKDKFIGYNEYCVTKPIYYSLFNNLFIIDNMGYYSKIILLIGSIFCLLISFDYFKKEKYNSYEYIILFGCSLLGMLLIVSAFDLLSIYLSIELQSLAFYILAAYKRNSEYSAEAGIKYFILGAFSSGLLLFGISLLYGLYGTTNLQELQILVNTEELSRHFQYTFQSHHFDESYQDSLIQPSELFFRATAIPLIFIGVALSFKLGAAPFHGWVPDVYEGAPRPVTAFFAIVPKIGIFVLIFRIFFYTFGSFAVVNEFPCNMHIHYWQNLFIFTSLTSMLIACFGALHQRRIKRLLAYSAIGHVGYMSMVLAVGDYSSIVAVFVYIIIYMIMSIVLFALLLSIRTNNGKNKLIYLSDFGNLMRSNSYIGISLLVVIFSMVGLPPLAGFFGKLFIFKTVINHKFYFLAIIGVLTSVISAFYYIRLIKLSYFNNGVKWISYEINDAKSAYIISFSTIFLIFFCLNPKLLIILGMKAALSFS